MFPCGLRQVLLAVCLLAGLLVYYCAVMQTAGVMSPLSDRPVSHSSQKPMFEVHNFSSPSVLSASDRMQCVPTRTSPSVRVCVYPASMDVYISMSLLHTGGWEAHITRQIVQHMLAHPQAGFLDLGANIGVHGLVVAKLNRSVVAVEPFLQNVKRIHKSVGLNGLTSYRLVRNALSDYRGEAWLDIGWRNIGGSTIESSFSRVYNRKHRVHTIYMDDLLGVIPFTHVIIKVDIEGSEPRAFLKAHKLFNKLNVLAIYMEWGQIRKLASVSVEHIRNINAMKQLFKKHNLTPHTLQDTSGINQPLNETNWLHWPHDLVWLQTV